MLPQLLDKDAADVIAYDAVSDEEEGELQPGQVPGDGDTAAQDGQPEVSLVGEGDTEYHYRKKKLWTRKRRVSLHLM